MSPTRYQRYQDYVIKDGRLVGEFEAMYRDFDDPWEQTRHTGDLDKFLGLELLRTNGHRRALEYGCGLGQYTELLRRTLGQAAGLDISETAVAKARSRYPGTEFFVGDVLSTEPLAAFNLMRWCSHRSRGTSWISWPLSRICCGPNPEWALFTCSRSIRSGPSHMGATTSSI